MINATLCTTNTQEPWAANVDFTVAGTMWSTIVNKNYTHYKNLVLNENVVIVYKTSEFEIIARGTALLASPDEEGFAAVTITVTWLRLVEGDRMQDLDQADAITEAIVTQL